MAEKTLESRPNAEKTKERLEMLKLGITKVSFIFETGRKYHKILQMDHDGGKSTHAFIDKETGDVYKPAGWAKPAQHVRYNLLERSSREDC